MGANLYYHAIMRYFITGGAGFIGSNYVAHLFDNVNDLSKVTIYDKFTYAGNSRNIQEFNNQPTQNINDPSFKNYKN